MPHSAQIYPHDELLPTNIAGIEMRTPVLAASGTFGFGEEFADFVDLARLGGVMVKGMTIAPRRVAVMTESASQKPRRGCSTALDWRIPG